MKKYYLSHCAYAVIASVIWIHPNFLKASNDENLLERLSKSERLNYALRKFRDEKPDFSKLSRSEGSHKVFRRLSPRALDPRVDVTDRKAIDDYEQVSHKGIVRRTQSVEEVSPEMMKLISDK